MLLVTGVLAVTMDPLRRLLKDAAIAIKGEKIINIGKAAELEARFPNAERLDGRGMLALPGFIDTHVHSDQALLRSFADETTWRPFLFDYIFPLLRYRTTKDALVSLQLCILEMLKAGTTCFVDTMIHSRYEFDVLASAVAEMGLRGVLAKYVMPQAAFENNKIDTRTFHSEDESFASAERAIEHWNHVNNGRAQVWLGPLVPRDPETCTPSFYMRVAHVAAKTKTGAVLHLGAEQDDLKFFDESFHMRPVEFAWAYGLVGQNILLIGGCWLSNDEVQILVRTKTNVVHSPSANMKMASGVAPVAKLRGAGVNVTLGTDAGANNNAHDMIREMKAACLLQSISTMDPSALAAEDALACIQGLMKSNCTLTTKSHRRRVHLIFAC
ncbi:MAG: amidohydrolase family protein [Anaerolineae bacterium]|nr:amidohydrolase family protein [Anaerolineae bacterium]